jgi:hypothetical protein
MHLFFAALDLVKWFHYHYWDFDQFFALWTSTVLNGIDDRNFKNLPYFFYLFLIIRNCAQP